MSLAYGAVGALMSWAVKTRSGFTVEPPEVRLGHEPVLVAHCRDVIRAGRYDSHLV